MANSSDANSPGGSFGLTAGMDDLLAHSGNAGKGPKEPMTEPNMLDTEHPSLTPGIHHTTDYGHEAKGLPDSPTSGIAKSDGDFHKG